MWRWPGDRGRWVSSTWRRPAEGRTQGLRPHGEGLGLKAAWMRNPGPGSARPPRMLSSLQEEGRQPLAPHGCARLLNGLGWCGVGQRLRGNPREEPPADI